MLDQTFSLIDIPRVFTLFFLEGALSLDNALAIALIVRTLETEKREKALFYGIFSAFILRAIGILAIAFLVKYFWIKLLGAIYLLYIAVSHFFKKTHKHPKETKKKSLLTAIIQIEFTDFAFAIDSIIAGIALVGISYHPPKLPPKIWIVYLGGIAGIVMMRFAAKFFSYLIKKCNFLETSAHLIIALVGLKMLLGSFNLLPKHSEYILWSAIVLTFIPAIIKSKR